jgi:hypothetical protein
MERIELPVDGNRHGFGKVVQSRMGKKNPEV